MNIFRNLNKLSQSIDINQISNKIKSTAVNEKVKIAASTYVVGALYTGAYYGNGRRKITERRVYRIDSTFENSPRELRTGLKLARQKDEDELTGRMQPWVMLFWPITLPLMMSKPID